MGYINIKKYTEPKQLQDAVDKYFKHCADEDEVPSPAGLTYHLGLCKQSISNYRRGEGYEEYHDIIRRADAYIEYRTVQAGYGKHQGFAQFMLSRRFKYAETQKHEHAGDGEKPIAIKINWKVKDGNK